MNRFRHLLCTTLLIGLVGHAQSPLVTNDSIAQSKWVDSQYETMSLEDRIGQLFMVSLPSEARNSRTDQILDQAEQGKIGGVIFSKGGPVRQANLTNELQARSKYPLMIGIDAEWGLAMRLDSTYAFPWNLTLGAIQNDSTVEQIGQQIGKHARRLGVHINFAPVADVNVNPENPIIGNRSFGEDPINVADKVSAYSRGLEKAGVLSSVKHFPGHGDTATDSHEALPFLDFTRSRLDSVELLPFRQLIKSRASSIMVAHLAVKRLEKRKGHPSSLSKPIVTDLLKKELEFNGLVVTDALNMKAVSEFAPQGEVELQAFLAGNDLLLMPVNVDAANQKILEAYKKGTISEERLSKSVKKILLAKYKAGLQDWEPVQTEGLVADLNTVQDDLLYEQAMEQAITVIKNNVGLIPVRNLDNKRIAYVKFGDDDGSHFLEALRKYTKVDEIVAKDMSGYMGQLTKYNLVIVGLHKSNESPWKGHKFTENELFWLQQISQMGRSNTMLAVFTKPYALKDVVTFEKLDAVVVSYQNSKIAQEKTAEIIFGAIGAKGRLPVTANADYRFNMGLDTPVLARLGYSVPERVGVNSTALAKVDSLVNYGLSKSMFPGAQVLIAKKGKVIYQKSFGKPTYDSNDSITNDHIYDLASLTKILGTLPLTMKMVEEGELELNNTLSDLVPDYEDTKIKDVTVLKALSHYGRLPAWIAFYASTLDENKKPSTEFYSRHENENYSIKVIDGLYLANGYKDSIYDRIGRQSLKSNRYRYSDVPYYILKKYIETNKGNQLNNLLDSFMLRSLGATNTSYNPLERFDRSRLVPTEEDDYFRYKTVQGYVHDMGAAMQGGVGGHAGLFSNANDVAKIMQMYLQDGYYGGIRYLDSRTIKKFNTCYFCDKGVRRGVGFDKPQLEEKGPTCGCVSRESFGHSGFTGTYTWADPDEELVYVFLSNRTYPKMTNNLLVKSGLRTQIQQAIYDSLIN